MKRLLNGIGRWGEEKAAQYMISRGYQIIDRNVRTPYGEIDIIAQMQQNRVTPGDQDAWMTIFVEVKTRQTENFGYPEEAVTISKQKHLLASAEWFLMDHPEYDGDWRVDVIAIRILSDNPDNLRLLHLKDVITTESSSPWDE